MSDSFGRDKIAMEAWALAHEAIRAVKATRAIISDIWTTPDTGAALMFAISESGETNEIDAIRSLLVVVGQEIVDLALQSGYVSVSKAVDAELRKTGMFSRNTPGLKWSEHSELADTLMMLATAITPFEADIAADMFRTSSVYNWCGEAPITNMDIAFLVSRAAVLQENSDPKWISWCCKAVTAIYLRHPGVMDDLRVNLQKTRDRVKLAREKAGK